MALTESEIKVIIAAEVRKAGFDKAAKQANFLEKQFKKLGGTLLAVFSTQKLLAFSKASVKAFADDEKAAMRLTQTLNSLNLGFEDPRIAAFISSLETQSGVLDDQLRPAMESLLRTTGSVTQSQKLLTLAIDVAAGTGKDLTEVAADLSKAYVGNTKGLTKYNLGLAKTEIAGKSFLEIQELLTKQYSGQNAAYLTTYAGQVSQLRVAYANMQETIGKGLVDAFGRLSGKDGIPSATLAMQNFAIQVSDTINGVSILINYLNAIPGAMAALKGLNLSNFGILGVIQALGEKNRTGIKPFTIPMTISGQTDLYAKQDKARAKAEKDAAKRAKELDALRKKQETERLKREKLLAAQKRAQTIFDMENIQIVAALQGKIDGEQRARLVALLALNTENYVAAEKLADVIIRINEPALANLGVMIQAGDTIDEVVKKLITSQAKLAALQLTAEDFPELDNPFDEWNDTLDEILSKLLAILEMSMGGKKKAGAVDYSVLNRPALLLSGQRYQAMLDSIMGGNNPWDMAANAPIDYSQTSIMSSANQLAAQRYAAMQQNVNVYVSGNVVTEQDLVSSITESLYAQQKSGQQVVYSSTKL